jgi:hypothetical protein
LDASNVEGAFQTILTGKFMHCKIALLSILPSILQGPKLGDPFNLPLSDPNGSQSDAVDIYRIVSSKSLESSGDVIKPSGGETILVTPTADDGGSKQGKGCC